MRPKVYIYARWDECGNSILEQLKRLGLHPAESGRIRSKADGLMRQQIELYEKEGSGTSAEKAAQLRLLLP